MSERLRRSRPRPEWPPLIVAESVPRWMWWRDFVLTASVWILFVWLAVDEYDFMREAYVERYGLPTHTFKSHFPRFLQELRPDAVVIGILLFFLGTAGAITLRRRQRGFLMPAPMALPLAEEAGRVGMTEDDLAAARTLRIAVVHVEADGALRIESRGPLEP